MLEQTATEASPVADLTDRLADFIDGPPENEEIEEEEGTDESEEESQEDSEQEESEGEEATGSVEVDGQTIDLPAGTPPEVVKAVTAAIAEKERSLKADYTVKTQEAAQMRKAATEFHERTQQQAAFNQNHIMGIAKLHGLEAQVQEYNAINWNELADADPVTFMKYQHQRTELREAHAKLYNDLSTASNAEAQKQQHQRDVNKANGLAVLAKDLPGWGAEYAAKINDFGQKTYGFSADELGNIYDPRMVKVLSDAMKYQELRTKGVKPKQIVAAPKAFVKPGVKISQSTESERRARDNLRNTGKGAASLIAKYL